MLNKDIDVLKAWMDGKTIQRYDALDDVWVSSENEWLNPTYFDQYDWRIKPSSKQVDYQALIDSNLLVLFSDSCRDDYHYTTSRLVSIEGDNLYIDTTFTTWDTISFEDGLKQVTTTNTIYKLWKAGFSVEVEGSYDCNKLKDELYVVVLEGVREGYTL